MNLDRLAADADADQMAALMRQMALGIATYYGTLRGYGVPPRARLALTLQYQAATLAKMYGLRVDDE